MDIEQLMEDASVAMEGYKIVSEIKKPIQLTVGDKTYSIDFTAKKISKGNATNPEVAITISAADFAGLQSGKLNPMQAFMQGKIKAKGNLGVLMKFQPLQQKMEKITSRAKAKL